MPSKVPDHPIAKQVRLELLKVKADLESQLGTLSLNCTKVRSRCALDERTRRLPGTLGAPGAGAARRANGLAPPEARRRADALLLFREADRHVHLR